MHYQSNILYYDNPDATPGARITRDMMKNLSFSLAEVMGGSETRRFIKNTRIPNERELYGVVIKSIMLSMGDEVGHIATEVQVSRSSRGDYKKGRVDLVFDYRGTSFLVEIKVARVSVRSVAILDATGRLAPKKKLVKPWEQAVRQLQDLDAVSIGKAMRKKVVKLPLVIYLHIDKVTSGPIEEWEMRSIAAHADIVDRLCLLSEVNSAYSHHFNFFHLWELGPLRTSSRGQCLVEGEGNTNFYGFSIVGSVLL